MTIVYQPLPGYSVSGYRIGQSYEMDDADARALLSTGMFVELDAQQQADRVESDVVRLETQEINDDEAEEIDSYEGDE